MSDKRYIKGVSEDIEEKFNEIFETKAFPMNIKMIFMEDNKLKSLIKVEKINDKYGELLGEKHLLVLINEETYDKLDGDNGNAIEILFEQEINRIEVNPEKGTIKIRKPNISTDASILSKYGQDALIRANQLDDLVVEQEGDI